MSQTSLSLVIITFNEENNIGRCIQSVPFAKDILVIDSGSTDRTVQIARQLGARVMVESWRGFYKQKIRATAVAMNDWVLSLDADEALSPELAKEIEALISSDKFNEKDGYAMPRIANYLGKWIKHSGWYPDRQLRLFNRTRAEWVEGIPHERVKADNVGQLKNNLQHWVYKDFSQHIKSIDRQSSDEALQLVETQQSPGELTIVGVIKATILYYWKNKAYLDGWPGLVISISSMFHKLATQVKFKELKALKK